MFSRWVRCTYSDCPGIPTPLGQVIHATIFFTFALLLLHYKWSPSSSDSKAGLAGIKIEKFSELSNPEKYTKISD